MTKDMNKNDQKLGLGLSNGVMKGNDGLTQTNGGFVPSSPSQKPPKDAPQLAPAPAEEGRHSPMSLSTKFCYGVGHVFNDLCASMWFTYLLIFFEKVRLSSLVRIHVIHMPLQILRKGETFFSCTPPRGSHTSSNFCIRLDVLPWCVVSMGFTSRGKLARPVDRIFSQSIRY